MKMARKIFFLAVFYKSYKSPAVENHPEFEADAETGSIGDGSAGGGGAAIPFGAGSADP